MEKNLINLVLEHCENGDLDKYIKAQGGKAIPENQVWKFFIEICIGL
jgi:NIMA (never in mitosis gene a)-related kinase